MSKDLKIGMIIGVVLLIAATLMISFLSEGSLAERLKVKFNKEASPSPPDKINTEKDTPPGKTTDAETDENTERIHIVKDGQSIHDIADKYYGNKYMIIKIIDENRQIPDDNKLKAGMRLKIPE